MATTRIPLSMIARDPVVSAFFARGERDSGNAYAVPSPRQPVLNGGVAKQMERV